ncbi:unnamed protein product [Colias eurytheme]|nr:unnamed protein product [Colias eurytheme]
MTRFFMILVLIGLAVGGLSQVMLREQRPHSHAYRAPPYRHTDDGDDDVHGLVSDPEFAEEYHEAYHEVQKAKICILTPLKKYCIGEQHFSR